MKKPTREEYMGGQATHEEFYAAVAETAGIALAEDSELVQGVRKSTDEHYNDVPLAVWDRYAHAAQHAISQALKEHGDSWSIAGGVCVMKAAAREAVKQA